MQGFQPYQEKLFSIVNLREIISDNHSLIKFSNEIDFTFIYEITKDLYC